MPRKSELQEPLLMPTKAELLVAAGSKRPAPPPSSQKTAASKRAKLDVDDKDRPKKAAPKDEAKEDKPKKAAHKDEVKEDKPKKAAPKDEVKEDKPKKAAPKDEVQTDKPKKRSSNDEVKEEKPKKNESPKDQTKKDKPKKAAPKDEAKDKAKKAAPRDEAKDDKKQPAKDDPKTKKPSKLKSLDDHPLFSKELPDFYNMTEKQLRKLAKKCKNDPFKIGNVELPAVKDRVPVEHYVDWDDTDLKVVDKVVTEDGEEGEETTTETTIYEDPDEDSCDDGDVADEVRGDGEVPEELSEKTSVDMYDRMTREQDERRAELDPDDFLKHLMMKHCSVAEIEGMGFSRTSTKIRPPRRKSKKSKQEEEELEEGEFDPSEWTVEEGQNDVFGGDESDDDDDESVSESSSEEELDSDDDDSDSSDASDDDEKGPKNSKA